MAGEVLTGANVPFFGPHLVRVAPEVLIQPDAVHGLAGQDARHALNAG